MDTSLEAEINEVKELLVDIERPTTRNLMSPDTIDMLRKNLTHRFKKLLSLKHIDEAKKVDKDTHTIISPCSIQDRPQRTTTSYKENPSSSQAQEEQESPS